MPIKQQFIYEWPEGSKPMDIDEWVGTLSDDEQIEFLEARSRQVAYRQKVINEGKMKMVPYQGYIWKDAEARTNNKPMDDVWLSYHTRFIKENNIKFKGVDIEIPPDDIDNN